MGMLLSIYLESCAGPNVMMQQVTQRMDDAGQDPCGAHSWAPKAAKLLTVVAPPAGSLPLPRRSRGASVGTLQLWYPLLLRQDSCSYP